MFVLENAQIPFVLKLHFNYGNAKPKTDDFLPLFLGLHILMFLQASECEVLQE